MKRMSSRNLKPLRQRIDRLDVQLLRLLNRRAAVARQVGAVKRHAGHPVYDGMREAQILRRLARMTHGPLPAASVRRIYRAILAASRRLEAGVAARRAGE